MWINPQNQQTFITHSQIRSAFLNISFPSFMSDEDILSVGLLPILHVTAPLFDRRIERVEESAPIKINGMWSQQWQIIALTPEEQQNIAQQIKAEVVNATQTRLDTFAQSRNYDNILSLCTYANSQIIKFATEGQYGIKVRDQTWTKLYDIFAEVEAGTRPQPASYEDIEPELPTLEWPTGGVDGLQN